MPNPGKTVKIRDACHKELEELAEVTGHKIHSLVDRALLNFLRDYGPVYRKHAKELNKPRIIPIETP